MTTNLWNCWWPLLLSLLTLSILSGCATLNERPPVETFAQSLADQAVIPAMRAGLEQGIEQLTLQAGAQAINPTYVVRFAGKYVTGIEGEAAVGVTGLAGQLQVTTVGSDETEPSPFRQEADPNVPVPTEAPGPDLEDTGADPNDPVAARATT